MVPEGVDKSTAIRLDKKIRNLKSDNCIALGDSAEDLKMASEVKFFFLMNDAIEKDREILKSLLEYENVYVTRSRMNRGWVEVMKYLAQ
jgi:hydroxymethylpyrimidine pyrophosphatase-like HAD family hydrolase